MKRRHFLHYAALFGASSVITLGTHGCAVRSNTVSDALERSPTSQRLIVVFLRGAADGLNIVVPHQDPAYYDWRPGIAIAPPGEPDGALDLDGYFGLHPALADLMPQWQAGHLAFVHNTGLPDPVRSHFDAQDYMEGGLPGVKAVPNGWLNRFLGVLTHTTPTQAVSLGGLTPLIFSGKEAIASVNVSANGIKPLAIDQPDVQQAFDQLYSNANSHHDLLNTMYREGRSAREQLLQELSPAWLNASGAADADSFSRSAKAIAQLMAGDTQTQLAFLDLGGWDTHVNQGFNLNEQLERLNLGLATLIEALGDLYTDTTIVVMSEFGRTVKENGNRGTDHGHGNIMWLLSGSLNGEQMLGEWSGLEESQLNEGRDLTVTTDFRDVMASLFSDRWGLNTNQLAQVFPDYQPKTLQIF